MSEKEFRKFVKKARDISQKVNSERKMGKESWGYGQEKAFDIYIQYSQWEQNRQLVKTTWWLMFATWVLAIATIILSAISLFIN